MINHCTRRRFLIALLMSAPIFSVGAEEPPKPARLNVVDYFKMLPPETLEAPPAAWLGTARVDKENGYISAGGDGAQAPFEVALFRFRDDRPLLAVCQGQLLEDDSVHSDSVYLEFYVLGPKGQMQKTSRSIFPVKDSFDKHRFILPRNGRTIIVRDLSGKHERKFTWNGAEFVVEK